jgi:ribosomal-protein-alanine N-acetyltransferase
MLRTLYKSDIAQILVIEKSVHVSPWTDDTFKMCFNAGYFGWAVEQEGKVIGFIVISLNKDECHVLNLCVAIENQHQGWGRKMLNHALNHAKQHGVGIAYLEVRRSNSRAIALYRKMNFHLVGERKNYYPTVVGNEDALIFAISLHLPLVDV